MKSLILSIMLVILSSEVLAENNTKKEIIDRCRAMMGDYGASLVKVCVDEDIKAVNALNKYPNKYKPIVSRCMHQMREYGFNLVKVCADEDIKAEKALSNY